MFLRPENGFAKNGTSLKIKQYQEGNIREWTHLKDFSTKANLDIEYNVLIIGTRKDAHAKKYWKGTERLKPKNNDKKPLT